MLIEVAEMRERIAAAKRPEGPWDTKLGKGRQQEIELAGAGRALLMAGGARRDVAAGLNAGVAIGWLDDADRDGAVAAYALCWQVLQAARLLSDKPLDPDQIGAGGAGFVMRETGFASLDQRCWRRLEAATVNAAAEIIDGALARQPRGFEMERDPLDHKGLIREAYRIEGITLGECRSIFLDWALSTPDGADSRPV